MFWVSYQLHVGCGRCCFQLGSSVAYSVVIVTDSNNNSYWRTFTQTVWLIVVVRFGNLHKHTREPQNIVLPNMCDSFMYKSKIIPSHTLDCILVCTNCCVAVPLELTHLVDAQIFDTICKAHINPTSSTVFQTMWSKYRNNLWFSAESNSIAAVSREIDRSLDFAHWENGFAVYMN